jgi:integrase
VRVVGPEGVQLDFRWKGRRHRPRIRLTTTKANLEYCKRWKRKIEDEIALGTFVWEKHFPDHENPCPNQSTLKLREFLLDYIKTLAGQIQPETIKEYEQCAEIVAAGMHNPPMEKATRAAFRTWISKQTLSKNRIDNLLTPVRGAFRQAVEDETLDSNPLEGFQVRKSKRARENEEVDPFTPGRDCEALAEKQSVGALWTFWAWTGLRSWRSYRAAMA